MADLFPATEAEHLFCHLSCRQVLQSRCVLECNALYRLSMRQESLKADMKDDAEMFDAWSYVAVCCRLRVLRLCVEFYRSVFNNPMYAKLLQPTFERCGQTVMADDLNDPLATLDAHLSSQIFKAVATLNARNVTKRSKNKGSGAATNQLARLLGTRYGECCRSTPKRVVGWMLWPTCDAVSSLAFSNDHAVLLYLEKVWS